MLPGLMVRDDLLELLTVEGASGGSAGDNRREHIQGGMGRAGRRLHSCRLRRRKEVK